MTNKKLQLPELDEQTILKINQRLDFFAQLNKKNNDAWFSELCFCILTANSKATTALNIQNEMSKSGFAKKTQTQIADIIKKHGHRFHNTKASYIFAARKYTRIKDMVRKMDSKEARIFLVKEIKGIGYKEASHFLRNIGYSDVAIIDRHILRFMLQEKLISEIPKTISPKKYLEYEKILGKFNIPLNELDLILWAKMTGKVLK